MIVLRRPGHPRRRRPGCEQPAVAAATRRALPLRILGFGTYDSARHPRAGILLDGLRAAGDEVVEANRPVGFTTAERVALLRRPWTAGSFALRLLRCWWSIARQGRAARRRGRFDAVVVGYLGHFDVVLARVLFPRDRIVLDLLVFAADTARDRGTANRALLGLLGALDRVASACADIILVDTDEHLGLLDRRSRRRALVVPVGAPQAWLAPRPAGSSRPTGSSRPAPGSRPAGPLRVVWFGLYTPLQGCPVIGAALADLAVSDDVEVTMIGGGQDFEATRRLGAVNNRVRWIDWVDPAGLPAVVAGHDVCLGIFGTTPKARRVVPNKLFQGAAAGCALVTSDTPPQRRALGDAALYVPAGDGEALAEALRRLAADPAGVAALRAGAAALAEARFTPRQVVSGLRKRLEPGVPRRPARH